MFLRLTKISFLLLIFSLAFMQPYVYITGFRAIPADIIFLLTFGFWFLSLLTKQTRFRWHPFYLLLIFYFAAMAVSAVFSVNPRTSFVKLLAEIYLLSLPVLTFNLIENERDLKRSLQVWLAATGFVAAIGFLTVFLFYFQRENQLLNYTLFSFGTLPPGNYPRVHLTFLNANMLCNYLSVSLVFLLIFEKLGWINKKIFAALLGGIFFCAAFTISPSLGGIGLSLGVWCWLCFRKSKPLFAGASLAAGAAAAVLFIFAVTVAPSLHPTAPFFVDVPVIEKRIAPSGRIMTWMDSWKTFAENPLVGRGVGQDACDVRYLDLTGTLQTLTDAHNVFLNVAAQMGVFGLLAIILIIFYVARKTFPLAFDETRASVFRTGFGLAFIGAFFYQGIAGSYEDARHLWVLTGFFLVSEAGKNEIERP
ncbi:MAG TPA: O-antigen ligase family protein [Pyrinomonadaceae bacterium]|nr:O-antigen ligase family protein [Pyrinomonadaceae bacterium]